MPRPSLPNPIASRYRAFPPRFCASVDSLLLRRARMASRNRAAISSSIFGLTFFNYDRW